MKNFLMENQWSQSRKSKLITAYVGLTLRFIVGVAIIIASGIFFTEMTEDATAPNIFVLCALVPILAVVIVFGDIYIRYKLDIIPLKKKKEQKKNPLEFK